MDVPMHVEYCCNCGIPFQMTQDLFERLKKCHNTFYCPVGHGQHYTGETDEERLKRRVAQLEAAQQEREADFAKQLRVARQKSTKKVKGKKPAKSGLR